MKLTSRPGFWDHVFDWYDTGRHKVSRLVIGFTAYATAIYALNELTPKWLEFGIAEAPYEVAGGALSVLLVLRTNAGHDRWWEARKLWGGITNQSRNLAVVALANGPTDHQWRLEFVGWVAAFGHVARRNLRGEIPSKEDLAALVGTEQADRIAAAQHGPTAVALTLANLLREARDNDAFDRFAYLQAEEQRALLIDHIGGCERILKTPLATAYVVLIRRFMVLFFLTLPFALMPRVGWLTAPFTMLIAYPILALDQIADDLQHPFSTRSINHLPLDAITATIEGDLLALVAADRPANVA